ncbi:hypothetical protein TD95_004040 [Thielaviopsis punctulata]|uniref:Pantoate--beta-alanine ligase n=1 Tax=Thielaviopsis punctulata TaxID=72032 RepID=A0A0F4ZFK4_9PEZI|nr:hypothetical protein TD95_004040 [Thielaviopsis punctulata]
MRQSTRSFSRLSLFPAVAVSPTIRTAPLLRITCFHLRQSLPHPARPRTHITSRRAKMSASAATAAPVIPGTSIAVLRDLPALQRWRQPLAASHRQVALVPTMGALHAGHLSLIRAAARDNHHVVVSIYLNPAQFGATEDLDSYPVTWDADVAALAALDRELAADGGNLGRISAVFAPSTQVMYPSGFPGQAVDSVGSFVSITPVGSVLEGASRPTFFRGVATVCMKLFSAVQPQRVYFGQKDVQQTVVIRTLVRDFLLPLEVVVCPTQRGDDGLALSSRNVYLGQRRRRVATVLYEGLKRAEEVLKQGVMDRESVLGAATEWVDKVLMQQKQMPAKDRVLFEVDYISLAHPETMQELQTVDGAKGAILSGAITFLPVEEPQAGEDLGHSGGPAVRLIDNIIFKGQE